MEKQPAALVPNRAHQHRNAVKALGEVRATGHTLMAASLGNRAGFVHAFAQGLSVIEGRTAQHRRRGHARQG